jgi:hydroxyacyl-ACP dehydratase HTD2-like protein with hotdog domain
MIEAGTEIPVIERTPDELDLFAFSAAAWLLHRIHYDVPFTVEHDGHPGLLVHGPLQGTYMIQSVQWWLGPQAALQSITYRHSHPAYVGERLRCGGKVTSVDGGSFTADLWIRTGADEGVVTTSGTATFRLPV